MPYYLRCLKITFPKESTLALLSHPSRTYKTKTRATRLNRICTGMPSQMPGQMRLGQTRLSQMRRSSPDFCRGRYSHAISFTYPETGAIRSNSRIPGIKLRKCDSIFTFDSGTRSIWYWLVRLLGRTCLGFRREGWRLTCREDGIRITRRNDSGLRGPWRRYTGRAGSRDTISLFQPETATVTSNCWVPCVKLGKSDIES